MTANHGERVPIAALGEHRSFEPRSGMGRAVRFILRNFRELGRFFRFPSIPPENNIAKGCSQAREKNRSAGGVRRSQGEE